MQTNKILEAEVIFARHVNDNRISFSTTKSCKSCRYWGLINEGECDNSALKAYDIEGNSIFTEPDFGCNQFEAK